MHRTPITYFGMNLKHGVGGFGGNWYDNLRESTVVYCCYLDPFIVYIHKIKEIKRALL